MKQKKKKTVATRNQDSEQQAEDRMSRAMESLDLVP